MLRRNDSAVVSHKKINGSIKNNLEVPVAVILYAKSRNLINLKRT